MTLSGREAANFFSPPERSAGGVLPSARRESPPHPGLRGHAAFQRRRSFLLLARATAPTTPREMAAPLQFDLLIKNGIVVTASDEVRADVAVKDGKVVMLALGLEAPEGCRVIDAEGGYVTVRGRTPCSPKISRSALTSSSACSPGWSTRTCTSPNRLQRHWAQRAQTTGPRQVDLPSQVSRLSVSFRVSRGD